MIRLIKKKRDGESHTAVEIKEIIDGYVDGTIPDYQVAAWLMAVVFNGLDDNETAYLTEAMMHSGDTIDLSSIEGIKVDKHSTGGVGDKTTLVLAPLVASLGIPVAKMSGRGLGHTGGTLDKLEAISGFSVDMTVEDFIDKVNKIGIAICGQSKNLVPADKMLYALRDVTATVDNRSLISSSIMSKKLACGADGIVIDLKVGNGAFIKSVEDGEELARIMITTAAKMNKKLIAVLTGMDQPLGYAIGNSLEVKESIETLKGHGPEDLTALCIELGAYMTMIGGKASDKEEAKRLIREAIDSGAAIDKFRQLLISQGGDPAIIENPDLLPVSKLSKSLDATSSGYITSLNALEIGLSCVALGAGRETKESDIDMGAGLVLHKKIGDYVNQGDSLLTLFANSDNQIEKALGLLKNTFTFGSEKPELQPLIFKVIE